MQSEDFSDRRLKNRKLPPKSEIFSVFINDGIVGIRLQTECRGYDESNWVHAVIQTKHSVSKTSHFSSNLGLVPLGFTSDKAVGMASSAIAKFLYKNMSGIKNYDVPLCTSVYLFIQNRREVLRCTETWKRSGECLNWVVDLIRVCKNHESGPRITR